MADWKGVDHKEFASFLREQRKLHEVHTAYMIAENTRIWYIRARAYNAAAATWIAKEEKAGGNTFHYIAQ